MESWAHFERIRRSVRLAAETLAPTIRVAPLKGAYLCGTARAHPAERPMRDADLLVTGAPLLETVRRLARAGFVMADVPRAFGVVSMRLDEPGSPWLDLHARPLPPGLGRVTSDFLLADAEPDERAFGAHVWLLRPSRVAVHLVGNVLKDRILDASPHAATDLATALRDDPELPSTLARDLLSVGLGRAGATVVQWALASSDADALELLADALEREGFPRVEAARRLASLRRLPRGGRLARLTVRASADRLPDRLLAVAAALAMKPMVPIRRRRFARAAAR